MGEKGDGEMKMVDDWKSEQTDRERLRTVPLTDDELELVGEYASWDSSIQPPPVFWQERLLAEIRQNRDKYGEPETI